MTPMHGVEKISHRWEETRLISDAPEFFQKLLAAIAGAQYSIDFEYYIFNADDLGEQFIVALGDAAARGVQVRVLIDGIGSVLDGADIARRLFDLGVEVRIYHPLPWLTSAWRWSRDQTSWLAQLFTYLLTVNRRNHRKLCVVDGHQAWVGSFNISVDHLPVDAGGRGWRDYAVFLAGDGVHSLSQTFELLWSRQKAHFHRGFIARYLSNRSLSARRLKNRFVVRSVEGARERVWLVSAYFAPTARLRRCLLRACRNGVQVRLILPGQSDVFVFPRLSSYYYHELLQAGARLFLYQGGVLHAKALLIDGFFIVGSSNWNHRSTLHDLELDVVIRDAAQVKELESLVETDCNDSIELRAENLPPRSLGARLWYLFRYWM